MNEMRFTENRYRCWNEKTCCRSEYGSHENCKKIN